MLLVPAVQSLHIDLASVSHFQFSLSQVISIFTAIFDEGERKGVMMKTLNFNFSGHCIDLVSSELWRHNRLPPIPGFLNKDWLQLAKTLFEAGYFGCESNNFSRIIFVGRGMAGKSRLIQALKSPPHFKADPIPRDNRSIGSDLIPLSLRAADGHPVEALAHDCAGQRVSYISHCVLLNDDCLYVLVWSPFQEGHENGHASLKEGHAKEKANGFAALSNKYAILCSCGSVFLLCMHLTRKLFSLALIMTHRLDLMNQVFWLRDLHGGMVTQKSTMIWQQK